MKSKINLFGDICKVITASTNPQQTLDTMVEMIAGRLDIDVCSVYLIDEASEELVLRATVGLQPQSVGMIRMGLHEGLTGWVLETMQPVFVIHPSRHARHKYFKGSDEELYETFLGLPLVYHQRRLGVMVIQTRQTDAISESDIPFFTALGSQISATAAYTGLLENMAREGQPPSWQEKSDETQNSSATTPMQKDLLRGIPVSSGFAEGYACYPRQSISFDQIPLSYSDNKAEEIKRLEKAFREAEGEVSQLAGRVEDLAEQDQAIIETHLMLLQDEVFKDKIKAQIEQQEVTAEYALKKVVLKHLVFFMKLDDPYLQERGADVEDIGKRVLRHLFGLQESMTTDLEQETIIVAPDISPVDLVALKQPNLKGIVLSGGGKTSHTVIMAKSFEIPMVIGVKSALDTVKKHDFLIVDGNSGLVFRKPSREIIEEYARLRQEMESRFQVLTALKSFKAQTPDGHEIRLGANVGLLSDMQLVEKYGADHVGLYRTEFPFLVRKQFPSEEEQVALYRKIIEAAGDCRVTIRTLDVGGDKFLPYLKFPAEINPFLGWRSVRVSLELKDVFRTQLRAILKASAFGKIRLMFPMITSVSEIREIREILEHEKNTLTAAGIPFDTGIPIGMMIEVPAAVKILDRLLNYVDFVSIGSNDLIQYILAVDRNNQKVASIYNPLHPAVIATIFEVVSICRRMRKTVSVCGESASSPQCAFLYLGMQVDQLSMNPASIPLIKDLIRSVSFREAEAVLQQVRVMEDTDEISAFLDRLGIFEKYRYY